MSWEEDFVALMQTTSAGTAVYPVPGPPNPPFPHVTYRPSAAPAAGRTRDQSGSVRLDNVKVQVNIKGDTRVAVLTLFENIRQILDGASGTPETGSGKYRVFVNNFYDFQDVGEDKPIRVMDITFWRRA